MASPRYSDEELGQHFGYRSGGKDKMFPGTIIDCPMELGYRCQQGHGNLDRSEYNDHLWCYPCQKDYHYGEECFLVKDKYNPKKLPIQPPVIESIGNWTADGNGFNDVPKELLPR